jgi:hypothetical protein
MLGGLNPLPDDMIPKQEHRSDEPDKSANRDPNHIILHELELQHSRDQQRTEQVEGSGQTRNGAEGGSEHHSLLACANVLLSAAAIANAIGRFVENIRTEITFGLHLNGLDQVDDTPRLRLRINVALKSMSRNSSHFREKIPLLKNVERGSIF